MKSDWLRVWFIELNCLRVVFLVSMIGIGIVLVLDVVYREFVMIGMLRFLK